VPNGAENRQLNLCSFDGVLCHDGHALLSESALESHAPTHWGAMAFVFVLAVEKSANATASKGKPLSGARGPSLSSMASTNRWPRRMPYRQSNPPIQSGH